MASALYTLHIMHCRTAPKRHKFRYPVQALYLDLDDLPALDRSSRWFGYNRLRPLGFNDDDHGARDGSSPKQWMIDACQEHLGLEIDQVYLLCFPRTLGYGFKPISVYYGYQNGVAKAVMYEVSNAYKQQHSYLLALNQEAPFHRHSAAKAFHVSPFMVETCSYHFRTDIPSLEPGAPFRLYIRQTNDQAQETTFLAAWHGTGQPLTPAALRSCFLTALPLAWRITGRIWYQALRLRLRGLKFRKAPPPPDQPISAP